ncbi:AMP-binding protein [Ferrimicrobium sp.]|uniref:AMP-binding protein n=1 Tax=Ferrimicrobium sp. TaxID=2926050 RepID=UPI00260F8C9A|nr:AMP-binding protein [Ferrimicrobium sp.]
MNKLVAIQLAPSQQLIDSIAECWANDDAVAVLDPRSPRERIRERLAVLAPHQLIDAAGTHDLDRDAPPLPPDSRIAITTSGTTGPPKAIIHTAENLLASAQSISKRLDIDRDDIWYCPLSPAYIGGLAVIARSLLLGNRVLLSQRLDQPSVDAARSAGATLTVAVTAALSTVTFDGFRVVLLGAQPPPEQVPANAIVTYGMTETGSGVIYNGYPLAGVDVRIINDIIELKGPMIAGRYRDLSPVIEEDGWLHTGDLGAWDEDGSLHVLGRASEIINSGGHKVNPLRVEAAIRSRFGRELGDLCIVGTRDDRFGEAVTLVTTGPSGLALSELRNQLDTLERWELPRRIVMVDLIPRTETGKPMRKVLSQRLSSN